MSQSQLNQSFQSSMNNFPMNNNSQISSARGYPIGYGQLSGAAGQMAQAQMEQRLYQNMYPRLSNNQRLPLFMKMETMKKDQPNDQQSMNESAFERMQTERILSQNPFSANLFADPREDLMTFFPPQVDSSKNGRLTDDLEMQKDIDQIGEPFGQNQVAPLRASTFCQTTDQVNTNESSAQCGT